MRQDWIHIDKCLNIQVSEALETTEERSTVGEKLVYTSKYVFAVIPTSNNQNLFFFFSFSYSLVNKKILEEFYGFLWKLYFIKKTPEIKLLNFK